MGSQSFASAYNAQPKLIVIIVIDQFRGDYLERYHDQFGQGGFRLLIDHGAYFPNCYYNYANTTTAAGHSTLATGAYTSGHGILANEWWDPQKSSMVTSVEDEATQLVGITSKEPGASPRNLRADTLGDELKLATQGKGRVFGISLKDRAAILSTGFSADGAYWIDGKSGMWITSTYYRSELPRWVQSFNDSKRVEKYLNREWKDDSGTVLRTTTPEAGKSLDFYHTVGSTPFGNDYELEFARELITYEKLGQDPATDLLVVSLSPNDVLGHEVGPDTPEMRAMALALDRQLGDFFNFLGHELGLANVWIALSADHGVAPAAGDAFKLRIPTPETSSSKLRAAVNRALSAQLSPGHDTEFVANFGPALAWLNAKAFAALNIKEEDAEVKVGEAFKQEGARGYFTKSQLAAGSLPTADMGALYAHSYSPLGGWYVMTMPPPFGQFGGKGSTHGTPYNYDRHVPLAFYGIPFQPGIYRMSSEPIDLAVTLASLLGTNSPSQATGRVLTEALTPVRHAEGEAASVSKGNHQ